MRTAPKGSFIKAIKGKVIIALLLACFALFMAWTVSKGAFKEMLNTVENISTPSERLRLVNLVSRKIGSFDQLQKTQALNDSKNYSRLFKESRQLRLVLDTLANLYSNDSLQLARITKIKRLLAERDQQFVNYLSVRERLVNNKAFSEQVKSLNEIVSRSGEQTDSTILATEEKTSTTTIYPEEKPRGFLGKLFGRKKNANDNSIKIVNEEKIKRDTIALSAEDRLVKNIEQSLRSLENEQRKNNASFLNKEAVLANANNMLVSQMMDVLRKVESEVVNQVELNGIQAKKVMNTSVATISIIMLVFVLLTGLLLYLILTDITNSGRYRIELEVARDEAEYHGRAKQRFLSNMSHEIRTPLQSIIGYTELIRRQEYPKTTDIDAIYNSSEHLLQIVNEVLDYNRIISGKFTFLNKTFEIAELLNEVIAVMRPQAELKSLDMVTDFELEGISYIDGDPFRLKQILFNLLGNAIKFTPKGEVKLSAFYKKQAEQVHFTFVVKDTGIGLSEEESKRIFNEFERVDSQESNMVNATGTGLGLTIIKSLVENQGGRIYVKSKAGKGSAFSVYLTFKIAMKPEIEQLKALNIKKVLASKVWIVDDDQLILDLCEIIFKKNNIDYVSFSSPIQMLDAEWDGSIKHVLMDMRMPEMNGIILCKRLREKVDKDVKIYAITAQVLPDEREFLLSSGFDGIVTKPFRERELLSVLFETYQEMESEDNIKENVLPLRKNKPDLSALKKMTFDDEEQLARILLRFNEDSTNDSKAIRYAMEKEDLDTVSLLAHRLAGRIGQIGLTDLSRGFRLFEQELKDTEVLKVHTKEKIEILLKRLEETCYSIS